MNGSLLDNDFYAFTQQQAIHHYYPHSVAEYRITYRRGTPFLPKNELYKEIIRLGTLRFTSGDLDYLESLNYFRSDYLQYLKKFRLPLSSVIIDKDNIAVRGRWADVILWETPLLSILSSFMTGSIDYEKQLNLIEEKSTRVHFPVIEMGTRRRASFELQSLILDILSKNPNLKGTSNVWFARQFDLKPLGTTSHQWYSAHQALYGLRMANHMSLRNWQEFYPEDLWVGLTDTFTSDLFFKEREDIHLGKPHRKCSAYRQDSGDPLTYISRYGLRYNKVIFSDGLTIDRVKDIHKTLFIEDPSRPYGLHQYGIGTSLTNDTENPPSIVMKLIYVDGRPCVKLSDDEGKESGPTRESIEKVRKELNNE